MLRFIFKFVLALAVNAVAFYLAQRWIPGFMLPGGIYDLILIALLFTLLNAIVKPIFKLFLSPIILITLGLGLIAVNAIVLKLLDFMTERLTIETTVALLLATLLISLVNFILHRLFKPFR